MCRTTKSVVEQNGKQQGVQRSRARTQLETNTSLRQLRKASDQRAHSEQELESDPTPQRPKPPQHSSAPSHSSSQHTGLQESYTPSSLPRHTPLLRLGNPVLLLLLRHLLFPPCDVRLVGLFCRLVIKHCTPLISSLLPPLPPVKDPPTRYRSWR